MVFDPIPASEALQRLSSRPAAPSGGFIDVRAPVEFAHAGIPGFASGPILTDGQREEVGTVYRQHGQAAAIARGHALVSDRGERIGAWRRLTGGDGEAVVTCWRGGLRSQIAVTWMREAGIAARQVEGGYQAMRQCLLAVFDALPPLWVLSGLTGCGKTDLLRELDVAKIDLEALAHHRGSAFGRLGEQPRQVWFENTLALALLHRQDPHWVEDESATLGQLLVPRPLKERMRHAPVVILEASLDERVRRIHAEYVEAPLRAGADPQALCGELEQSLSRLERRLGRERLESIRCGLRRGFERGGVDGHAEWIADLLGHYYDRSYTFALERQRRRIVFRGDFAACRDWIRDKAAIWRRPIGNLT
jgi:tRNA 2-selenouridine synthase